MSNAAKLPTQERRKGVKPAARDIIYYEDPFCEAIAFLRGPEAIEPGDRIAAICRVTTLEQERNGSLDKQKATARKVVSERGARVEFIYPKAGIGGDSPKWLNYLDKVFQRIAERGIRKVVITELSRLLRSPYFGNDNLNARPSPQQLGQVERLAAKRGITIICLLSPDSSFEAERSYQNERNGGSGRPKGVKNKKPGWSKQRREAFMPIALAAVDTGKSYREAAKIANDAMREADRFIQEITHEAVRTWRQRRDGKGEIGMRS